MYELIDFAEGRRLERFGMYLLDRPAAGTEDIERDAVALKLRAQATARFESATSGSSAKRGRWIPTGALPESWIVEIGGIRLALKPTEFGHLGVFPEQAENWRFIGDWIRAFHANGFARRPKVLNLFAYTGGSTIAAAAAGAAVVHVDSARGTVAWARRNAGLNGLADAPIRWIVEDVRRFVARESARGNRYDAVILDPPSYGHGPSGQAWKIDRDLPDLLRASISLLADGPSLVLLSWHTPGVTHAIAARLVEEAARSAERSGRIASGELSLRTASGRKVLPCGVVARYTLD